jgi:superfamily II DNA or RNA helicase
MHPEKGYRRDFLWLPKKQITNLKGMKAALSFDRDGEAPIYAWEENNTHLIVPREFIPVGQYPSLSFQVKDLLTWDFPRANFGTRTHLRDAVQKLAFSALVDKGSGILALSCGKGKTVISLHAAAALGMPTMIIVNTSDLAHQWKSRIIEHTTIKEEDIGWIQGSKWDWQDKPICIAMVQTLSSRSDEVPIELTRHYGTVIYDEVHILGAPYFNKTAGMFHGVRWGLSATWERSDGLEELYRYHLGEILYENLDHDIIPTIFFVKTGVELPTKLHKMKKLRDMTGDLSIAKINTWLAEHDGRNRLIMENLSSAHDEGRKLLVLGERVNQLRMLHGAYPDSGLIYGKVKGKDRESQLQDHDIVFAIAQLAKQGLDRKELDTLFILFPFTDEGRFRQMMGRIQRAYSDKLPPFVMIFEDENIPTHKAMCRRLRRHLKALKYPFHIVSAE